MRRSMALVLEHDGLAVREAASAAEAMIVLGDCGDRRRRLRRAHAGRGGRRRPAPRDQGARLRDRSHSRHRFRHHRSGGRCDQGRGLRLSDQAGRSRPAADHGEARGGAARPRARGAAACASTSARSIGSSASAGRCRRWSAGEPARAVGQHRAHHRRERHAARSWWRARSISRVRGAPASSCRSTAPRCPRRSSRASCSAIARAPSPAPPTDKKGLLEEAHRGVLFLDEIGEMPPSMQVRLLRFLQGGEVRRVGDTETRRVDVRLVAATHRTLEDEVARGALPAGLLLPHQRHQPAGAAVCASGPTMCRRWPSISCTASPLRLRRSVTGFTPSAMERLVSYGWPGNVRELENAIERAANVASGEIITEADLPAAVTVSAPATADEGGEAAVRRPARARQPRAPSPPRGARARALESEPRRRTARHEPHHPLAQDARTSHSVVGRFSRRSAVAAGPGEGVDVNTATAHNSRRPRPACAARARVRGRPPSPHCCNTLSTASARASRERAHLRVNHSHSDGT